MTIILLRLTNIHAVCRADVPVPCRGHSEGESPPAGIVPRAFGGSMKQLLCWLAQRTCSFAQRENYHATWMCVTQEVLQTPTHRVLRCRQVLLHDPRCMVGRVPSRQPLYSALQQCTWASWWSRLFAPLRVAWMSRVASVSTVHACFPWLLTVVLAVRV